MNKKVYSAPQIEELEVLKNTNMWVNGNGTDGGWPADDPNFDPFACFDGINS